jgi:hypothetical protein
MTLPKKCIVDTNVPLVANKALDPDSIPDELKDCVVACIEALEHVTKTPDCLVLDAGDEIYREYTNKLSRSGQPGMGDMFMKWVHDNRWALAEGNRVAITKIAQNIYEEFPEHDDLNNFDPSDRKFVAVANAHPAHPPILNAADSDWWISRNALKQAGIAVVFLCQKYVQIIEARKTRR